MGESGKQPIQLSFNRFLRVAFQGSRVTSNRGLILVRELDERLGFGELIKQRLADPRGKNTTIAPSVGGQWLYTHESRRAKKLIPDKIE